jgi:hypothetical protein
MRVNKQYMKMIPMLRQTLLALTSVAPFALVHPAAAQDASFGCKVLLCAAATAPSWSGIPYCVPVMQQLFTQLAKGGGWPSCAEGDASPVGYQPYGDCPAGATPIAVSQAGTSGRGGVGATTYNLNVNGSQCGAPEPTQTASSGDCAGAYVGGIETVTNGRNGATVFNGGQCYALTARPANPTPYYVDIATANGVSRFSFSLDGY